MHKTEIDEIERLAKEATPGRWPCWSDKDIAEQITIDECLRPVVVPTDAEYIASVSSDVTLKLIAYVRRLEKENEIIKNRLIKSERVCKAIKGWGYHNFRITSNMDANEVELTIAMQEWNELKEASDE